MVYTAFLIPLLFAVGLIIFYKRKIVWWEIVGMWAVSALLIFVGKVIAVHSLADDTEYFGGYVTEVRYYEPWNEYIQQTCSSTCCCDKDGNNCSTTYYDCSYVSYHSEYWLKMTTLGDWGITQSEYNKLCRQFGVKPTFHEMDRDYYTIDGNMYYGKWQGNDASLEPVATEHDYENRPKAAINVYNFVSPDTSEIKRYSLKDYPRISGDIQRCLLGVVDKEAEHALQVLNARLGASKQLRVFIIVFPDQPREAGIQQENYWQGGNKNEFVICIGTHQGRITWAHPFSWTDQTITKVNIRTAIEGIPLDLTKIVALSRAELESHWIRKQFHDFDYLHIEPSFKAVVWILILTTLLNIGLAIWIVENEFPGDEEPPSLVSYNNRQPYGVRKFRRY